MVHQLSQLSLCRLSSLKPVNQKGDLDGKIGVIVPREIDCELKTPIIRDDLAIHCIIIKKLT